jgi:uncharacterized protein YdeI (YjbR/CyaY-like superfamily)
MTAGDAPIFFASAAEWRAWLQQHHDAASECAVGYYKKGTGKPSMTWPESVDVALCFGWIDGVRHGIDDERYRIRFTPRKRTSTWSAVNIKRVPELVAEGSMTPAGLAAFEARRENRSGIYSYEQRPEALPSAMEQRMRADGAAWTYFEAQSASYRRAVIWWIVSAKQEATRERRLATLIEQCAAGRPLRQFTRP